MCTIVQLKVQWKHFEVYDATWENEATMRKDFPFLFHDIIQCPQNTKDDVVLSGEGCDIPNLGCTIYRHEPIDHDEYIDFLFLYWVKDTTTYEHDDLLLILGISQLLMIQVYICWLCWAWTLKYMIDEKLVLGMDPKEHDR